MPDLTPPTPAVLPSDVPATDPVPATDTSPDAPRKARDKVRSAWIAFVGRIVAQLIGAAATVVLGVYVMHGYARRADVAGAPPAAPSGTAPAASPVTAGVVRARSGAGLSLLVLPFQDYSPGAGSAHIARGLTEALTSTLARDRQVQVISRTTATHAGASTQPLPAIAAALSVDLVVEGSTTRQGDTVRVTVQLIDARSDEHLWVQTYDRRTRDVLALEAEVSAAISRELTAVLPRATSDAGATTASSSGAPRDARWLLAVQQ